MGATAAEGAETAVDNTWEALSISVLASASWRASAEVRSARHGTAGYCPTAQAPYGDSDPRGAAVNPACDATDCLDLHHDLIIRVRNKVLRHRDANPDRPIISLAAFVTKVAKSELIELQRKDRTKMGFPARPTRDDGAAGRVNGALARDHERGAWLVRLFRVMRGYPFGKNHVCASWPLDGLLIEREKFLPGGDLNCIRREIDLVLATARAELGVAWVHDNLITPLMSRAKTAELDVNLSEGETPFEDLAMVGMLRQEYWGFRYQGYSSRAAVRAASQAVCGTSPATEHDLLEAIEVLDPWNHDPWNYEPRATPRRST